MYVVNYRFHTRRAAVGRYQSPFIPQLKVGYRHKHKYRYTGFDEVLERPTPGEKPLQSSYQP